jgi:hypothetical protein
MNKKNIKALLYIFSIEIFLWFLFINIKTVFIYSSWNILFLFLFFLVFVITLILVFLAFKHLQKLDLTSVLKVMSIILIITSSYIVLTWDLTFKYDKFGDIEYRKIETFPQIIHSPKEYLNWLKSDQDKLRYLKDLHVYDVNDYTHIMSIPFVVNFETAIKYDRSIFYNSLYLWESVIIKKPTLSRYFYNDTFINSIKYGKGDFYLFMKKEIDEYFK